VCGKVKVSLVFGFLITESSTSFNFIQSF